MTQYTVKQLAGLAGVSVRTLHYYDEIDLLKPQNRSETNNYRYYGEEELLRLQQILLYRELDVSLEQIKRILNNPGYDLLQALKEQKAKISTRWYIPPWRGSKIINNC